MAHEPKVSFVHQVRSLKRVIGSLPPHIVLCQVAQLLIQNDHKLVQRVLVAVAHFLQYSGDFAGFTHHVPETQLTATLRQLFPADQQSSDSRQLPHWEIPWPFWRPNIVNVAANSGSK